jgi:hypothetical protein
MDRVEVGPAGPVRPTQQPARRLDIEPRWPVALAILTALVLLAVLPGRIRVFPAWFPWSVGIILLIPILALRLTRAKALWLRVERWTTLIFFVVAGSATLVGLGYVIDAMVSRSSEVGGMELLTSSIAVWVTNVLIFSLVYWEIDRGGPEARANGTGTRPDWLFPQEGAPQDSPPGWRPTFVDYFFLGYATATAFSTTDVMPLTSRAKLLMMLESTISLATILIVVSRAVNILGS